MGRPTDYKPEYCQMLIDHMSQGRSFETFAAIIDACPRVIYKWANEFPDFMQAKSIAFNRCLLFWEKEGIAGLYSTKTRSFNSSVWIFNMKARFRWRDEEMKELPQVPEIRELTLEEKKLLLPRVKEDLKKLEEELAQSNAIQISS